MTIPARPDPSPLTVPHPPSASSDDHEAATAGAQTGRPSHPDLGRPSQGRPGTEVRLARFARGLVRPTVATGAGILLYLAFPPVGCWPLAPVAVAILTITLAHPVRARAAYGLGLLFGLGFFVPLLRFVSFVGADGHLVLSAGQAAIAAVVAPATAVVWRLRGRWLWVAAAWVGQEALRGRAPFGGFPWGRLAFSQPDSPFTPLAALGGAPLVTAAVAGVGALLATAALAASGSVSRTATGAAAGWPQPERPRPGTRRPGAILRGRRSTLIAPASSNPSNPRNPRSPRRPNDRDAGQASTDLRHGPGRNVGPRRAVLPVAGAAALTLAGLAVALPTAPQAGTLRVAAVQGNVPVGGGFGALGEPFQVTANHVAGTERLAADVRAGRMPAPELVLWPENSSDIDPFANRRAAAMLDRAAGAAGVPILLGAVLDGPGAGQVRNAGLVWDDSGWTGDIYVKRHPVPFGEYLPGRALLERLIGRFAEEMPNDFVAGSEPGVIRVAGATLGDVICFEVAYDSIVRDTVDGGAQLLVVQTNNASFGRKGESEQQLAMSRLRAVEHGRATVQVSTTGQSAIITPDGTIVAASGLYEAAILAAELPLRTSPTVADQVGVIPEAVLASFGLLAIIAGYRTRRGERAHLVPPSGDAAGNGGRGEAPEGGDDVGGRAVGHQEGKRVDGKRVVVCMPTYNERENLRETAGRLRAANPGVDLLVIDDASPDGTGEIADALAADDPQIHVLHRDGKSGLGTAYVAGFSWALQRGYDVVVEMDADGSHQPEELPRLLAALDTADLVIGSRWVNGGEIRNWPRSRMLLSRGGNAYVRAALGMPLRDATAGYRAYRASVLAERDLDKVASQGYCFQVDLAWQAWRAGFQVTEVPITFVERERGTSKMSRAIVAEALWRVTWWAASTPRRRPRPRPAPDPVPPPTPPAAATAAAVHPRSPDAAEATTQATLTPAARNSGPGGV